MNSIFNSEILCNKIKPIIDVCPLWKDKDLTVVLIVNPLAGGFTVQKRAIVHLTAFDKAISCVKDKPVCVKKSEYIIHETEYAGNGTVFTADILKQVENKAKENIDNNWSFLIITAGGDGNSLEVQTALTKAALGDDSIKELVAERITVLRLPLGTGNDGSDGRTMDEALERLTKPAHFSLQRTVKVTYQGQIDSDANADGGIDPLPPWYSFNIASVGIDAFVTHMTNKMKKMMPGDSYKLWLDIACLFYNVKFPAGTFHVQVKDSKDAVIQEIHEKGEFCLLGVSGYRTYGSGQKILPNDNNFCMTRKMSVIQKVIMQKKFITGKHFGDSLAYFNKSEKIIIDYDKDLLVQMDGESHLLHPEQFPLIMERTKPLIRMIECDDAVLDKGAEAINA